MPRNEFKATEGLLHDVMRKQAGTLEKAVLEAVMNSVDANADEIEVHLQSDKLIVRDDGDGMTEEEVEEYFEQFGYKDEDIQDKDFGKFRMGRGQIFNFGVNIWHSNNNLMVVNLNEDTTEVQRGLLHNDSEVELDSVGPKTATLDTAGLSYNMQRASGSVEGCRIKVNLYQLLDDVEEKVSEIRDLVKYIPYLHDVSLTINDDEVYHEPEVMAETELAIYAELKDQYYGSTEIYNQGAYVKRESIAKTPTEIISKVDLDVNFARNDILETDDVFPAIMEEFKYSLALHLIERRQMSKSERKWVLEMASQDDSIMAAAKDTPLIETVTGEQVPLSDAEKQDVAFSTKDDSLAKEQTEDGDVLFVDDEFEDSLRSMMEPGSIKSYEDAIQQGNRFEMTEYDYGDLNSSRQMNFDRIKWVLDQVGFRDELRPGYSQHKDVWKNDEGVLYVDKLFLKAPKREFILEHIPQILKVAAHDGDTRQEFNENFALQRRWYQYTEDLGSLQVELLDNNAP